MAMGYPTQGDPVMVDISTSSTTNNLLARLRRQGKMLPHPLLMDEDGVPTNDPAALVPPRQGTILPAGGLENGHKGYGLALMVEALTAGLSNRGRHEPSAKFANTIFVQILDPAAFGGTDGFKDQMNRISEACQNTLPRPGVDKVRLPGERGLALARDYHRNGVRLAEGILDALKPWAEKLGVAMPAARTSAHPAP
jgi:L-lactate dehydrogenase